MNRSIAIVIAALAALIAQNAQGRILNVPEDHQTIQAAIDAAENSDTVLVEPGRYEETITFSGNNVVVASHFLTTANDEFIASTIIDGSIGNGHSVVAIREGEGEGAELAGFTITGGRTDYGGGVYCTGTAPYLHHLIIEDNEADHNGGGLYTTQVARATCRNLIIRNNHANLGGGGITCYYSAVTTVEDCIISANRAAYGAGVQCSQSAELIMRGCTIADNDGIDGEGAGGLWAWVNARVSLIDCIITGNRQNQVSGLVVNSTSLSLEHVLLARNEGGVLINYTTEQNQGRFLRMDAVTIVDNIYTNSWLLYMYGDGVTLTNSIYLGSAEQPPLVRVVGEMSIGYSLVEGGEEIIEEGEAEWGEGILDQDPLFIDRENGDYSLSPDSPCIDAGDSEAEPDPDGTRRDLGAFPILQRACWLGGSVVDTQNGEPLWRALVSVRMANGWGYDRLTNIDGLWGHWIGLPEEEMGVTVSISLDPYTQWEGNFGLRREDSLFIEAQMGIGVLTAPEDTLFAGVVAGDSTILPIELHNIGNVPLSWTADWRGLGIMSSVQGEIVRSVSVGQILEVSRLQGVAFDGEMYYISGHDSGSEPPNNIYEFDNEFHLIGQFSQPGAVARYGMKDLAWDGELLWGAGEDSIYGFTRDGEIVRRFPAVHTPEQNFAFDPERNWLWISGITSGIAAIDSTGTVLASYDRMRLRIYGLAWDAGDPDGNNLVILHRPRDISCIYKMNIETGDTVFVAVIPAPEGGSGAYGLDIVHRDGASAHAMFVHNITTEFGGDRLDEVQLRPNTEWIDLAPEGGIIEPQNSIDLLVTLFSGGRFSAWEFEPGSYNGEVTVSHDGRVGEWKIPIRLTVSPNSVSEERQLQMPVDFASISAFPQPFNTSLTVDYRLNVPGVVRLSVVNLAGQQVAVIEEGCHTAGEYQASLNAEALSSGVYLVKLEAGGIAVGRKVVCLK